MLKRKLTKEIKIGNIYIGGENKIAIQSMTNTKTKDVDATLKQINDLYKYGCDIVRVAILDIEDANSLYAICDASPIPVVADIHFDYRLALIAIDAGISKIRINPGNIGSIDRIEKVVNACKEKNIPIRIGVNNGSINKEIAKKYGTDAKALVESAKEHIEILEKLDFHNIVVSIKASNVLKTIEAYTLFSEEYDYPVHLGLTEAGTIYSGSIKSSIAIGHLLLNGIGDTIRVSLTDDPVKEIIAAKEILSALGLYAKPELISCPTCGRCQYNMIPIASSISDYLNTKTGKIKVAVMGCAVNGPGEAKDADLGIAGSKNSALLFKKGRVIRKIPEESILSELKNEITMQLDNITFKYFDKLNDDIISLRTKIFVEEQGFTEEFDDIDDNSTFVLIYKNGKAIGTGRFFKESADTYHLGRICVLKDYRLNGYGSIILMLLENKITSLYENIDNIDITLKLSSQNQAKAFYEKLNYIDTLNDYYEQDCLHNRLQKIYHK